MKTIECKFVQFPEVRKKFFQWVIENNHQETYDYEQKLKIWDEFISHSIINRIECDVIGVNPQYRSIIQRYWSANVIVAEQDRQEYIRRQTDRQTDNIVVPTYNIQNANDNSSEQDVESASREDEEEQTSEDEYIEDSQTDTSSDDSHSASSESQY